MDEPEKIAEWYGMRWGIETAHRCEDEFRINLTSPVEV
jgi:IS4 transposase